jgi:hypothetical protein
MAGGPNEAKKLMANRCCSTTGSALNAAASRSATSTATTGSVA